MWWMTTTPPYGPGPSGRARYPSIRSMVGLANGPEGSVRAVPPSDSIRAARALRRGCGYGGCALASLAERVVYVLSRFRNAVVEGPPGTGKTHVVAGIRAHWTAVT